MRIHEVEIVVIIAISVPYLLRLRVSYRCIVQCISRIILLTFIVNGRRIIHRNREADNQRLAGKLLITDCLSRVSRS